MSSAQFILDMRPYFRHVAGRLVIGSIAGVVMNTAVVLPAVFLGLAIDKVLALERGEAAPSAVALAAAAYLGAVLLTEGTRVLKRWWLMTANARIRANVRADAFRGVLAWPMEKLHRTPIGDVMARIVGDVEVLGVGVREFTIEMWDTVLFSLSLVVVMFVYDPELALIALIPVPVAMVLAHQSGRWVAGRTVAVRAAAARLTSSIRELLAGVRVLRLFGRTDTATLRVTDLSERQGAAALQLVRLRIGLLPVYTILMTAGIVLVIWQGGTRVVGGAMTLGSFVAFMELYLRFVDRGFRVPQLVNSVQSGTAAHSRLKPLLAPARLVRDEPKFSSFAAAYIAGSLDPSTVASVRAPGPVAVELEDVTFRYPGAPAPSLRQLSLRIPAGALVAVTGHVGAGKSALARAICGVYPLESGTVLLDGRPAGQLSPADRQRLIGYLPQEAQLFSGTVRANIMFGSHGSSVSDELLTDAIEIAALDQDLLSFPAGADTRIGELGARVSGGQRQRIALARAIAASATVPPGLIILDEPFSSVDVATEARIVASLRQAFGPDASLDRRATVVLCSHRLTAFPLADMVVVLEAGRIVELGTHQALMEARAAYSRIYDAQRRVLLAEQASVPA